MRISIEGIRGSGKSSILKLLSYLKYKIHPVEKRGEDIWTSLYLSNKDKFSLGYNLKLLLEQVNTEYHSHQIHLYENSPYTLQTIWSEIMVKKGFLHEEELKLQDEIIDRWGWMPECIIFLDCPAEICLDRLKALDSKTKPTLSELRDLSGAYDWALDYSNCDIPVYRVNANDNLVNVFFHIVQILCQIKKHSLWFKNNPAPTIPITKGPSGSLSSSNSSPSANDLELDDLDGRLSPLIHSNPRAAFNHLIRKPNYIESVLQSYEEG